MESLILEQKNIKCYHCNDTCKDTHIHIEDKYFCCEGCKGVYQLLNENDMCTYYAMNENAGAKQVNVREDKFSFLDNPDIASKLLHYQDEKQSRVRFYLPHIHCSSCLWLLEHISKLNEGILSSKVNFPAKEVELVFDNTISLRKVAELLTSIGYEPYISLQDTQKEGKTSIDKTRIYKIGVAGFCFGNIMMMSFPEYFAGENNVSEGLGVFFRYFNLGLSLPVLLYSGSEFFTTAYKGLKAKTLNIDLPIALALVVTFGRSLYEVLSGTGSGYFDSMAGIIFFMLLGRLLQDKTYSAISFNRDYKSYFPIAVTRLINGKEETVALPDIKKGDILLIHNEELIPTDGILSKGNAEIDYSFITGESIPVEKNVGEITYAGGKQMGSNIELLVTHEVNQSYLTDLWNNGRFTAKKPQNDSFIHLYSQYFTVILLSLALATAAYWYVYNIDKLLPAVTAMLIVACPCALLLSATFTYSNILNIFAKHKLYVRSAEAAEMLCNADTLVFDKTGTLTQNTQFEVEYIGKLLSDTDIKAIQSLTVHSKHPLSIALHKHLSETNSRQLTDIKEFVAETGKGIKGYIEDKHFRIGSAEYVNAVPHQNESQGATVHISIDNHYFGYFRINNKYRNGIQSLLKKLQNHFSLAVLSGDNAAEEAHLTEMVGEKATIRFYQKPQDKADFIHDLQAQGKKVMMVGDGLNDAGALQQSDIGIAVSENANYFTPACDAILHADSVTQLYNFIRLAKAGRNIIRASFAISILYNIIGLYIAVQGDMSPLIAAILMPISSISIILFTFGMSVLMGNVYLKK